jgi:hypothetical protein
MPDKQDKQKHRLKLSDQKLCLPIPSYMLQYVNLQKLCLPIRCYVTICLVNLQKELFSIATFFVLTKEIVTDRIVP